MERHRRLRIPYHPMRWTSPPLFSHATRNPAGYLSSLDGTTLPSTTVIWTRTLMTHPGFHIVRSINLGCQDWNLVCWEVRLLLPSFEQLG